MDSKTPYEQLVWNGIKKSSNNSNTNGITDNNISTNNSSNTINNTTIINNNLQKKNTTPFKVKLSLTKECKVSLKPSNKVIAIILSKIPGASYDVKANEWSFPVEHYDDVSKELAKNKILFDKIPGGTINLAKRTYNYTSHCFNGNIYDILMDFQREAVNFAINRNGRILLADDMGLGKTIQALAIAYHYRLEYPLLIITPASLGCNWLESIQRFLGEEATLVREKSDFGGKMIILSYDLAVRFIDVITAYKFGITICDECHYLKSMTSKRTRLLLPVLQKCSRLIMISGTPATSRPLELYPILCALDKSLYPNFQVYGNRYCDGRKIGQYFDYKGCSNAVELATVIEKAFMIRRTKNDVLTQLPKKFRRQVLLETPGKAPVMTVGDVLGDILDTGIMAEYKQAAQIKKNPVLAYIDGILEKGVKCLVFAHHKEMLDALESHCVEKGVKYVRIDGTTPTHKRHAMVEQYQTEEGVRIAILSLTACSTGLTLTSGKAVIFAELYWNPGTMLQAEDRVHRIGQSDNVDIHYLVGKNTIDEVVWPKLLKKLTVLESLGISKNELKTVKGTDVNQKIQGRLNFTRTNQ